MLTKKVVLGTLASDAFIQVNKRLAKLIGPIEALFLGELISRYRYWSNKEHYGLTKEDTFYATIKDMWENTGISGDVQSRIIKQLSKKNIIEQTVQGMPAKRYFKLNFDIIYTLIENDDPECPPTAEDGNKVPSITEQVSDIPGISFGDSQNNIKINNKNKDENKLATYVDTEGQHIPNETLHQSNNDINSEKNINIYNDKKVEKDSSVAPPETVKSKSVEKPKEKRRTLFVKCAELINSEFDDPDVKDELYKYLQFRITRGLSVEQWIEILKELRSIAITKKEAIESIKKSFMNNWMSFFPVSNKNNSNPAQARVTTTINQPRKPMCTDKVY